MSAELTEIAPGVVRLTWSPVLQDEGTATASERIRNTIRAAFAGGLVRIETYIDPDDRAAQRIATMSGLMREGIARGVEAGADRIVYARLATDMPVEEAAGFRSLLNSFLPRKRAIGQMLVRDADDRVLLCQLTYKHDFDLPGGVVEVGESPRDATSREVTEELALQIPAGELILTDWLPPWGGWDDAVCLVFDGGVHSPDILDRVVQQEREIRSVGFYALSEVREHCADFTARRVEAALARLAGRGSSYTESGHRI